MVAIHSSVSALEQNRGQLLAMKVKKHLQNLSRISCLPNRILTLGERTLDGLRQKHLENYFGTTCCH